jgi:hypothetical protein
VRLTTRRVDTTSIFQAIPTTPAAGDLGDLLFIDFTGLQCLLQVTRRSRADGDRLRNARGQRRGGWMIR